MPSILKNHRYILFHSLATHHLIHLVYATTGIRDQRDENAQHRLCRAPFPKAHDKGRPAQFYPVKNFAVRFGKRQRTAQFVAVRNR
jgi:hypothetical protein